MGKFKFTKTGIKDMFVVEPTVFEDERGYFTWRGQRLLRVAR